MVSVRRVRRGSPPIAGVCIEAVAAACHDGGGGMGGEGCVMWGG